MRFDRSIPLVSNIVLIAAKKLITSCPEGANGGTQFSVNYYFFDQFSVNY